jgi:serine/threonine protein kinase
MPFKKLPGELVYGIFSFLVECEEQTLEAMMLVSPRWNAIANDRMLWRNVKQFNGDGSVNWRNFRKIKKKSAGTEGICHKCLCRSTGEVLAVKKARVFPEGEGVAYYMLRELAVLQDMNHPHVNKLSKANLCKDELHIFFPFVERTLQDVLVGTNPNAMAPPSGKTPLSPHQVRRLLHQLLDATAYCHRRGVYHRNLKPKHLLLDVPVAAGPGGELDLDHANLQIADFALVRASGLPRRNYTAKVVTLWYRAPEILMGVKEYSDVVDAWSVGCVFAEMALGRPLFTGSSEIDQLFQLFSTLGTPNNEIWKGFTELPNYGEIFPNWPSKPIEKIVPDLEPMGRQLLQRLLEFDPAKRITAEEALHHPYFTGPCEPERALVPFIDMPSEEEVPAHTRDIHHLHKHMRETEVKSWPIANYKGTDDDDAAPGQDALHRAMLVDWLVELVDVFDMYLRSAFLAVAYTDAFLSRTTVSRDQLQLVAATCLHVASKCEDTAYISVNDLVMCADNLYTSAEVLQMEEKLLNVLDFRLGVPNVYDFLKLLMEKLPVLLAPDSDVRWLSEYLAELSMQVSRLAMRRVAAPLALLSPPMRTSC